MTDTGWGIVLPLCAEPARKMVPGPFANKSFDRYHRTVLMDSCQTTSYSCQERLWGLPWRVVAAEPETPLS